MIHLADASVTFASSSKTERAVLSSIDFSVTAGEWVAVAGANGSGKTTLLRTIAGLESLSSGKLRFEADAKPRVAMLLQEPDNQFVTSSVRSELAISVPPEVDDSERVKRVLAAAESYALADLVHRNPHKLSGGEKQRLALATVWLQEPEVVLLDEPLAFLDPEMTRLCVDFVKEMHRGGTVILWATPGGDELGLAGRVVYLDEGRVVFDGSRDDFDEWAREHGAGDGSPGDALADARARKDTMASPDTMRTTFENVSFAYDGRRVLASVDFEFTGCTGVSGPNASGKTTLLLLAAGALTPSAGRITHSVSKGRVVYVPQSPERMFFAETVEEEIAFGPKRAGIASAELRERCVNALQAVGLDAEAMLSRAPLALSAGEMRRVALAVALALDPQFVLFDEPTAGLDRAGLESFLGVLERLRNDGAAVAIASHDTALLSHVCDRVACLRDGGVDRTIDPAGGLE